MRLGTFSGGGLGFGVAFTLEDQFTAVANRVQQKFDALAKDTEDMADKINNSFDRIYKGAGLVATGIAMLAPIGFAAKVAGEYEQITVAFETLIGDVERSNQLIGELQKFADITPFTDDDIMKSGRMLLGFGQQAESIIPTLENLGNVAAGVGVNMGTLVEIYGRNLSQPQIFSRDIYQFANYGIPIMDALATVMGRAKTEILDLASSGAIQISHMEEAFRVMGQEGGLFADMMIKQSTTMNGLLSTAQSYVTGVMRSIGGVILPGIKAVLTSFLLPALEFIKDFAKTGLGQFIIYTAMAITGLMAMGVILLGLKFIFIGLGMAIWGALAPLMPFIAAGVAIVGMLYLLNRLLRSSSQLFMGFGIALAFALGPIGWVAGGIMLMVRAWKEFTAVIDGTSTPQTGLIGWLQRVGGYMQGIIQIFRSASSEGWEMSQEMEDALASMGILDTVINIGTWITRLKGFFEGLKEGFMGFINEVYQGMVVFAQQFAPAQAIVEKMDAWFGKNTSSMERWKEIGVAVGKALALGLIVVVGVLALVIVALGIIAVQSLIAFSPMLLIIGLIGLAIYFVIKAIENMVEAWNWARDSVADTWLGEKLGITPSNRTKNPDSWEPSSNVAPASLDYWNNMGKDRAQINTQQAALGGMLSPSTETYIKETMESLNITLEMDGDKVAEKMIEKQELDNARTGRSSGTTGKW